MGWGYIPPRVGVGLGRFDLEPGVGGEEDEGVTRGICTEYFGTGQNGVKRRDRVRAMHRTKQRERSVT